MRIIAGKWRGRPLLAPAGDATRPTADRVREALFSMLASRLGSFDDLAVLDVFAGTGAFGLEALSRGAAHASFVDSDPAAIAALRLNIGRLSAQAVATVIAAPAVAVGRAVRACDLVLLDPPYGLGLAVPALAHLDARGWIAPHALIAIETGKGDVLDAIGFATETSRVHGKAVINLLRRV